jgi:hypothetical protein
VSASRKITGAPSDLQSVGVETPGSTPTTSSPSAHGAIFEFRAIWTHHDDTNDRYAGEKPHFASLPHSHLLVYHSYACTFDIIYPVGLYSLLLFLRMPCHATPLGGRWYRAVECREGNNDMHSRRYCIPREAQSRQISFSRRMVGGLADSIKY